VTAVRRYCATHAFQRTGFRSIDQQPLEIAVGYSQLPILDRLQDSFGPLNVSDVRELEADLGVTFPEAYAAVLMQYNCAYMQHPVEFKVRNPSCFVERGTFDKTLGDVKEWPYSETGRNIRWVVDALAGRLPPGLVPIASSGGDPICIGMDTHNYGRIYL
jgi:hypothetical protein